MANIVVDQEQQWLINCLNATLDTNQQVRSFAETSLHQASLQHGFGSALAKVAANREYPGGLRQLAAVLLKQFIKKHWSEDDDNFEEPIVTSDEKDIIRQLLLLCLDDSNSKICTAVSMAVASIALCDWPEDWADLVPFLMKLITDKANMNGDFSTSSGVKQMFFAVCHDLRMLALNFSGECCGVGKSITPDPDCLLVLSLRQSGLNYRLNCAVHGALRCLALLSADINDKAVPSLVSISFPSLLSIVSSPQIYNKSLRTKALSIVYNCTAMLGAMSGVYKAETSHLMSSMIQQWMVQFAVILSHPVESEDPDDWSLRMVVLKCLNQFVQNFSGATAREFTAIVGPLWQTFVTSLRIYEQAMIEGALDSFEGTYDSDGEEKSLESFAIQLLEFLLTIVGSARFTKVVTNNLQELVYFTFGFLQITEQQMHSWSLDANQYISDEDENMYNCRVSGVLLLEEIINSCGEEGIGAIVDAARRRFSESQHQKVTGSRLWWKMREAVIYAMASLSDQVQDAEVSAADGSDLKIFLEKLITEDIGTGAHEYPFLYARAFSSVPKFSSMISSQVVEHFLNAAITALGMDVPPPVKVGACQALSQILSEVNKEAIHPHIMQLFSSLIDLLNQASGESLHLVLETLQAAVKSGHEVSSTVEPVISPVVLSTWASNIADPFISIDAIEVLEAIKNAPGCIQPLVSRVLPYIGPILNQPNQQPDGLVAGSLDLVTMLLKSAPVDVIKAVYSVCFDPVIRIVLQSDDSSEMQNATECLAAFVCGGKDELLAWGGDPGVAMRSLLEALSRLLDPGLESSGSFFVGNYILQLILNLPSQMGQHIQDLVSALVRRMQSCQIAGLKNSLLLVLARLVHMSVPNVAQFIDLLVSIPAEGNSNAFAYLTSEWVKQQGEIHGSYQIKVTTTALALLLSTRHVALANNYVQGQLVQTSTGITTRSKAKSAPEQWTMIPLNAKILSLLADTLNEIQEQVTGHVDEDSDWEEVDAEDADIDQDLIQAATAKSSGKQAYDHLAAMAKIFENQNDEGEDDDLLSKSDPLNQINLATYLMDFLTKFYQSDGPLFDQICQILTQSQRHAIQMVLNR